MSNDKLKWLKMRKKTDPEYPYESPIWLGVRSNGEFYYPPTARDRRIRDEIRRRCDDNARKLGMDRREFMASAMGMVTSLSVINMASGCGNAQGMLPDPIVSNLAGARANGGSWGPSTGGVGGSSVASGISGVTGPQSSGGSVVSTPTSSNGGSSGPPLDGGIGGAPSPGGPGGMGGTPDGGYACSKDAMMNADMARALVGGSYFIMDMQTHHVGSPQGNRGLELNMCQNTVMNCTSPDNYIRAIFEMSETTVAVLSGVPGTVDPTAKDIMGIISNKQMQASRDRVNKTALPGAERMVAHGQVMVVQDANNLAAGMMECMQAGTIGWKVYPPSEGGWYLNDQRGTAFIQEAIKLFPDRPNKMHPVDHPLICVHKGFPLPGFSRPHCDPMPDVGKVATMYPDVNFIIYHSACEMASQENTPFTYDKSMPPPSNGGGTNRLWFVVTDNNLKGKNVYSEMGSAWKLCMTNTTTAQHYVGKALKHMGTDHVVWGSETTWFGCPQDQIDAFKMLVISKQYQDMYGYPELTEDVRKGVFGLNGARLYGIDPCAMRYKVTLDQAHMAKLQLDDELGPRRWALTNRPAITCRRDFEEIWREKRARGEQV